MKTNQKGSSKAKEILELIGFDDISEMPIADLMVAFDIIYIEEVLNSADGKIIRGKSRTLIKVNSQIKYTERKRFVASHELGHYFLHDKLDLHNDNSKTLNWFNLEEKAKRGIQEFEANDFASELLMPEKIFRSFIEKKSFGPELISDLGKRFKTSITSVIYRILTLDIVPICVIYIFDGKVRYWRRTSDFRCWIPDITKLPPPEDSVAKEYLDADYDFLYSGSEKAQTIDKSTWFKLNDWEDDIEFLEYCVPTKKHKTIISVIWEK
ncbi:ImmA/IrrE family metallo-endopeptidase [Aquimarina sp. 2-A2]|uniref:ImmA/IrrE family metallo-endopeptidase n=1 Tax=Aquimarina sp. 2-A2 TaxID=3382644 RepID=UPI00387F3646